jgi:hypothetical protein
MVAFFVIPTIGGIFCNRRFSASPEDSSCRRDDKKLSSIHFIEHNTSVQFRSNYFGIALVHKLQSLTVAGNKLARAFRYDFGWFLFPFGF